MESARIVGALARYTRDFALAEDVAQEALAEALVSWATAGIPDQPMAWLLAVGRRRAIDAFRRRAGADERYELLARDLDESTPGADLLFDPDAIDDDVLALIFTACHPVLPKEARIALTLRVVGGLTTDEIAKAFLVPVPTIQARITRAKKTLAAARVPFAMPEAADRAERLGSVLSVVYLIFTEGSSATSGDAWIRTDLAHEARGSASVLTRLAPEPEVFGLLALLELTAARFPARVDVDGRPVLLERPGPSALGPLRDPSAAAPRSRWRATSGRGLGAYGLQAAIAECHAVAASVAETDWDRIVCSTRRSGSSRRHRWSSSTARSPSRWRVDQRPDCAVVDEIAGRGELAGSHLLPAVRAELLARLGRVDDARHEYLAAASLCGNAAERAVLEAKAAELG